MTGIEAFFGITVLIVFVFGLSLLVAAFRKPY
jgi:hypothetical protein